MFYRPNFCCQCGEKVVRARWTLLTSRRFCDFCAIEQKQHDLLPRAVIVLAAVFGAAGITGFFSCGKPPSASPTGGRPITRANVVNNARPPVTAGTPDIRTPNPPQAPQAPPANTVQRQYHGNSSTEPVYYCGALTKKGTPCTRRVRSKGRCWQHAGDTAQ